MTISGKTITANTGNLTSFVTEGFQAGQRLQIAGTGTGDDTAVNAFGQPTTWDTILSVTDSTITLTTALPAVFAGCAGGASCVTLGKVVNQGIFSGLVNYDGCASMVNGACVGTLTRVDGSSWLDDGFLEGQLSSSRRAARCSRSRR